MSYELVLVLVGPEEPEPIDLACELVAQFMHDRDYQCCRENRDDDDGDGRPGCVATTGMPAPTSASDRWASYGAIDTAP